MRHLAAYILLVVGGNATPSAEDVTALLAKAGVEVDAERLTTLLTELEGKDIAELIEMGQDKICKGGGGGGGAAPAAAGGAPAAAPVEEKVKEEEVDVMDGGLDMFGGGGGGGDY